MAPKPGTRKAPRLTDSDVRRVLPSLALVAVTPLRKCAHWAYSGIPARIGVPGDSLCGLSSAFKPPWQDGGARAPGQVLKVRSG
jgi:hypothetical protein